MKRTDSNITIQVTPNSRYRNVKEILLLIFLTILSWYAGYRWEEDAWQQSTARKTDSLHQFQAQCQTKGGTVIVGNIAPTQDITFQCRKVVPVDSNTYVNNSITQ